MLGGITFFSHQLGSFMGIWLGGYLYDSQGNYDMLWYLMIALGVAGALINLPVRETAIAHPHWQPPPTHDDRTNHAHICAPAPPDLAAGLGMAGGCAGLAGRVSACTWTPDSCSPSPSKPGPVFKPLQIAAPA